MRLSDEQFYRLTPVKFMALLSRKEAQDLEERSRFAMICSVVANRHRGKGEKKYRISDFLPDSDGGARPGSKKVMSDAEILTAFKAAFPDKREKTE